LREIAKLTVNNERGPVEEHTGDTVGVRGELLTSEQAVEDQAGIGQTAGLNSHGRNGAAVGGISSTKPGKSRVVVGAICRAVLVIIAHVTVAALERESFVLLVNGRGSYERGG
jgi:hypothetical protein